MSRIVTKAQAAVHLGISPKEVVRRIEKGELKGRKKTASKFSDWLVELPDEQEEGKVVEEVKEVLGEPEVVEKITGEESLIEAEEEAFLKDKEELEQKEEEVPERKEEEVPKKERKEIQIPKKEDEKDARSKSNPIGWWYGNQG